MARTSPGIAAAAVPRTPSLSARTDERKTSLPLATPAVVHAHTASHRAEVAVVRLVNHERRARGLRGLRISARLAAVARNQTLDMLRSNRLDHTSSDGTTADVRIRRAVRTKASGETIAFASNGSGSGARSIVRLWMSSPAHAAVLLSPTFRRIGIGRERGRLGTAPGVVVTANLASRR